MELKPYASAKGYTVVYSNGAIKVITDKTSDVMDRVIFLPKALIKFILSFHLPSPLKIEIISHNEDIGGVIDAICFSPDEKRWFLTLKKLYYITK